MIKFILKIIRKIKIIKFERDLNKILTMRILSINVWK